MRLLFFRRALLLPSRYLAKKTVLMEQRKADPRSAPEPDVAFPTRNKCEVPTRTPLSGAVRGVPPQGLDKNELPLFELGL